MWSYSGVTSRIPDLDGGFQLLTLLIRSDQNRLSQIKILGPRFSLSQIFIRIILREGVDRLIGDHYQAAIHSVDSNKWELVSINSKVYFHSPKHEECPSLNDNTKIIGRMIVNPGHDICYNSFDDRKKLSCFRFIEGSSKITQAACIGYDDPPAILALGGLKLYLINNDTFNEDIQSIGDNFGPWKELVVMGDFIYAIDENNRVYYMNTKLTQLNIPVDAVDGSRLMITKKSMR